MGLEERLLRRSISTGASLSVLLRFCVPQTQDLPFQVRAAPDTRHGDPGRNLEARMARLSQSPSVENRRGTRAHYTMGTLAARNSCIQGNRDPYPLRSGERMHVCAWRRWPKKPPISRSWVSGPKNSRTITRSPTPPSCVLPPRLLQLRGQFEHIPLNGLRVIFPASRANPRQLPSVHEGGQRLCGLGASGLQT